MSIASPTLGVTNHFGITVGDLEEAAKKWRSYGFPASGQKGVSEEHKVEFLFLNMGNARAELLVPTSAESKIAKMAEKFPKGYVGHACYEVDDIGAARAYYAAEHGMTSGAPTIGADGLNISFFQLSDGPFLMEMVQAAEPGVVPSWPSNGPVQKLAAATIVTNDLATTVAKAEKCGWVSRGKVEHRAAAGPSTFFEAPGGVVYQFTTPEQAAAQFGAPKIILPYSSKRVASQFAGFTVELDPSAEYPSVEGRPNRMSWQPVGRSKEGAFVELTCVRPTGAEDDIGISINYHRPLPAGHRLG